MTSLMSVEKVCKSFGSVRVAHELSLHLHAGEALGIVGPNGAGKTTLFNLITGDIAVDSGTIAFQGRDITTLRPHRRCRAGIGRSYQIALPFVGMTVFENVLVGAMLGGDKSETVGSEIAIDVLCFCGLDAQANRL